MNKFRNRKNGPPKRYNWLSHLINENDWRLGAEIGCMKGNTSVRIMRNTSKFHLFCVDLWQHDYKILSDYCETTYKEWDFNQIKARFDQQMRPFRGKYTELRGISWEMTKEVEDESLDFVFIDADHAYEPVKKDILAWVPKVRKNGMISGHDINIPGVFQAVSELIPNYKEAGVDHIWYIEKEELGW